MVKKSQSELTTLFQLLSEQYILKKEALTFKESAIYSRISPSRLNTLTTNGEITHYVPYPGRVVFQKKIWIISFFRIKNMFCKKQKKITTIEEGYPMSKKTTEILWLILLQLKNQNRSYHVSWAHLYNFFFNESGHFIYFPPKENLLPWYYLNNNNFHLNSTQL